MKMKSTKNEMEHSRWLDSEMNRPDDNDDDDDDDHHRLS